MRHDHNPSPYRLAPRVRRASLPGAGSEPAPRNVRNRLYALEAMGLVICDEARPMRYLLPDRTIR